MLLIAVAWMYVVLMVAVVEATSTQGSLLGALITFALYGVLPISIVGYLFFSPARRRARRTAEGASAVRLVDDPDGGSHPAGDAVPPVREKP